MSFAAEKMAMNRQGDAMVFVARHGETDWNRLGRMQGRSGASLNERGRAQAAALARVARGFEPGFEIERIVTSPLPRARETSEVVAAALGCEVLVVDALMEIDFGLCGGLTEVEIEERFPGLTAARKLDKWSHRWPSGESYEDAVSRVRRAVEEGALPLDRRVLSIAHQSINRAVGHVLSELAPARLLAMAQRSDVLLRYRGSEVVHAFVPEGEGDPSSDRGPPLVWLDGPYLGGQLNLN